MSTPRRRFLKSLAAAPLLPRALVEPQRAPSPAPSPSPSPVPGPVAEALAEVVKRRYGSHLQAADLEDIQKGIEDNLQAAERLKKGMKLGNADEPVTLFRARPPAPSKR